MYTSDRTASKPKTRSNLPFIVELLLMFILLVVVIVVITMVSMKTRDQSLHARYLTEAVIHAENTAEVTAEAENAGDAAVMIEQMDGVEKVSVSGDKVSAEIDGYRIELAVAPEEGSSGTYIDEDINVYHGSDEVLYNLHAGWYKEGTR